MFLLTALASSVAAFKTSLHHASNSINLSSPTSFIRAMDFTHNLRVCNAYPFDAGLEVVRAEQELTDAAMPYKTCRDFNVKLKVGDRIDFKIGSVSAGTFAIQELPQNDAVLLLIIHRHDTATTTAAFASHVFSNVQTAQITTIDTYKGASTAVMKIEDPKHAESTRSEQLKFDSVVALNPGEYRIVMEQEGKPKASSTLMANQGEAYVVLRVGLDAQEGHKYPPELVVFPKAGTAGASMLSVLLPLLFLFIWY